MTVTPNTPCLPAAASRRPLQTELEPYASLWTVANEFSVRRESWLFGPIRELQPEEVDTLVGEWLKKVRPRGGAGGGAVPSQAGGAVGQMGRMCKCHTCMAMRHLRRAGRLSRRNMKQAGRNMHGMHWAALGLGP